MFLVKENPLAPFHPKGKKDPEAPEAAIVPYLPSGHGGSAAREVACGSVAARQKAVRKTTYFGAFSKATPT